jgi:hypothetical protein
MISLRTFWVQCYNKYELHVLLKLHSTSTMRNTFNARLLIKANQDLKNALAWWKSHTHTSWEAGILFFNESFIHIYIWLHILLYKIRSSSWHLYVHDVLWLHSYPMTLSCSPPCSRSSCLIVLLLFLLLLCFFIFILLVHISCTTWEVVLFVLEVFQFDAIETGTIPNVVHRQELAHRHDNSGV